MGYDEKARLGFIDYVTVVWFLIDSITHLTIELVRIAKMRKLQPVCMYSQGYVILTYYGGAREQTGAMADVWKLYAVAVSRLRCAHACSSLLRPALLCRIGGGRLWMVECGPLRF